MKDINELINEMMEEIMDTVNDYNREKIEAEEIAKHTKLLFDAFKDYGFTREEALELVITVLSK